eukprot:scaffold67455_cov22-Tisochrysis_lutea.AAC.1
MSHALGGGLELLEGGKIGQSLKDMKVAAAALPYAELLTILHVLSKKSRADRWHFARASLVEDHSDSIPAGDL